MSVKIVADSACDLPPHLVQAYDITIVPLVVTVNGRDVSHLYNDPDAFWEVVLQEGVRPQTAAPPPGQIAQVFASLVDAGHDVIAITLTGKLSGVYQAFRVAAASAGGRVHVFDSRSLSLGIGVQVLEAARMAAAGAGVAEILQHLTVLRARVRVLAVLDTVDWAERGGRIAYLMPVIRRAARLFNVKVLLSVEDGEVRLLGVQRAYRAALQVLKRHVLTLAPVTHLLVPHTRQHALAQTLADELAPALGLPREEVIVQEAGAVLGAHVGPGALGVAVVRAAG